MGRLHLAVSLDASLRFAAHRTNLYGCAAVLSYHPKLPHQEKPPLTFYFLLESVTSVSLLVGALCGFQNYFESRREPSKP